MHVASLAGYSGSGKTTLIVKLIEHYRALGQKVAAIKHTHHPLNDEDRGDTRLFRIAGAEPVILASGNGAVVHRGLTSSEHVAWSVPAELLRYCDEVDIVLVEGFKNQPSTWPQVTIEADNRPEVAELAAFLDRIWLSS
jgi:molybdopterin-guanine dinucleotide biosynthesis adapter protein